MDARNRKATFVLPTRILEEMAECVRRGMAHSISALVREALEDRLHSLREEMLAAEFEAAAKDSEFISDIDDTMRAFEHADRETAWLGRFFIGDAEPCDCCEASNRPIKLAFTCTSLR